MKSRNNYKKLTARQKSIWKDHASWHLLLLCIPALVGYILFNYLPMGMAIVIPFKNYKFAKGIWGSDWVGLKNFTWFLTNGGVLRALRNTFGYGLWFMFLGPVTNVIMALLLFEVSGRRKLKVYQTVITFPNFMSYVIVGFVTYALLSPTNGFLEDVVSFFGGEMPDVYMKSGYWPAILTIVSRWKGIGMGSMVYFAALMGVDTALYEAAEIDGATRFQKMRYISLPHLIPLVCIYIILGAQELINSGFDLYYVIPRDSKILYESTDVLATFIYRSLAEGRYSMGASVGLVQSVVGLILVVVANAVVRKISPENSLF